MPSFAPLHTGQFIIRPRTLKRTRLGWAVLAVAAVTLLYGCFELGRWLSGYSVVDATRETWRLQAKLEAAQEHIRSLDKDLNRTQMSARLDRQAIAELQKSLNDLQTNLQSQNEELSFYRGIMAPQGNAAAHPAVQQLRIEPGREAQHFELQLVLVQSMQVTSQAQGTLRVTVSGMRQGEPVQLSLKDLLPSQVDSIKFSYRYFQNVTQEIVLPADVEPQTVHIEMRAHAHPAQEQEFAWRLESAIRPS